MESISSLTETDSVAATVCDNGLCVQNSPTVAPLQRAAVSTSGDGQASGGGQESRCRGTERPHPALEGDAGADNSGKPRRGQNSIVPLSHTRFRRDSQGASAVTRRGGAVRCRGKTRRATPVLTVYGANSEPRKETRTTIRGRGME